MIKVEEKLEKIAYSSDASQIKGQARKIIFPLTTEEILEIIRRESNIVPRGAGTGLAGGAVPLNSVVVDLSRMNKILHIDKIRKEVYAEAGVVLGDLNHELGKYNLEFPVQPASFEVCTIGGMTATNAVGTRGVKYGKTSSWINEIEVITGDGELIKIRKLNLYDFSGMEGITGIIVKAKLKLIEKPVRSLSIFKFKELSETEKLVRKFKAEKEVSMIEFIDKLSAKILGWEEAYYLLVEFESEKGELKQENYEKAIKERTRLYPELAGQGYTHIEDPKIPLSNFFVLAEWLEKRKIPFFGHIGEGIIHPCLNSSQEEHIEEMMKLVKKLRGEISGEHGIGLKKKKFIEEADKKIIERTKKRYDSRFKLNLGKIIDCKETGEKNE